MSDFEGFQPLEANFTPTPNQFFDYVVPNFPPCVVSVVATIIRATLGWTDPLTGEKRIEAELSVADIQRRAKLSRNSARDGIRGALTAKLIIETAETYATSGARYALRWSDEARQRAAIERQRRALDDAPSKPKTSLREGDEGGGQKLTGSKSDPVKNCPPYKERNSQKKKDTDVSVKKSLNVSEAEVPSPAPSTPNEGGRGIYAIRDKAVSELIALTGDEGSLRRFQQLWEIAEGKGTLEAWNAALRATRRRLSGNARQALDRPGAYFDRICVQELEKREVFVPTIAEKQADLGVGNAIRQGLFGGEDRLGGEESLLAEEEEPAPQEAITEVVAPPLTATELAAELAVLESQGGAPYEAFLSFCEAERKRYEAEMGKVSQASRERLLAVFDRPEKRRDLYKKWKAAGQAL
ncbi:hypothetical protein [Armatimonas rosea]|uniref:Uncharacterized protein n=1 Tax=Armatimonas rosea TaxID=685828 RepID=A0A7W9SYA4_ARMRO|nr:hypothetical protein [Armatimonas rosea]MBB6054089.1 hypothetical protein [Armatimonas rosea]